MLNLKFLMSLLLKLVNLMGMFGSIAWFIASTPEALLTQRLICFVRFSGNQLQNLEDRNLIGSLYFRVNVAGFERSDTMSFSD